MDHNRVHLIGRLTKTPEFFSAGRKGPMHCTFTLAINRVVPNQEGPQADYVPCSLWGDEAQKFIESRDRGDTVGLFGRLRTNHVVQADGSYKFFWEVRVEEVFYGMRSLKNLQPKPEKNELTANLGRLSKEFKSGDGR